MGDEKPFMISLLNGLKDYYQMVHRGKEEEANPFVYLGYCRTCESIKGITQSRKVYQGSDCLGEHWDTIRVPPQCFDFRHENVIEFSVADIINLRVFFGRRFVKEFVGLLDSWPQKEHFPNKGNPHIYDTNSHKRLALLYWAWYNLSENEKEAQLSDLLLLQHNKKKLEDRLKPINELLC